LVEEVQKLQSALNKLRENGAATIARLEEELAAKSRAFALLEDKIATQDDYDEVKRELK
jgi:homeobox protein cut-like